MGQEIYLVHKYSLLLQVASLSWCKAPDVGLPRPDRVFYLTLPVQDAGERAVFGEERYEKVDFQKIVQQQFEELRGEEWLNIDASKDIDTIHREILADSLQVIASCSSKSISELWKD